MSFKMITSNQNEYIKKITKLQKRKYREELGLFIVEGERSCKEALASRFLIDSVLMTEEFSKRHKSEYSDFDVTITTDKIFSSVCDTKTPQGIMVIAKIPSSSSLSGTSYIYCDFVQDPGNVGTIIRSADAFGFDGVIFSKGCVDVFSPKVIRSTMGSIFHIDVLTDADAYTLKSAKRDGFTISATALNPDSTKLCDIKKSKKRIFVVGNEGNGVSCDVLDCADEIVYIPMKGSAESLNVGVAASILMYEVSKNE